MPQGDNMSNTNLLINMNRKETLDSQASQELVGKQTLLEKLFPNEADRPSTRWLDMQCAKRAVPFVRLGRLIWFDVPQVRAAFAARMIAPRSR
jgi:hypothetical protein